MEGVKYDDGSQTLNYELWDAQQDAIEDFYNNDDSYITDFRAGYRAGKSITGARAIIQGAWGLDNTRWLVMSETYKEGQRTTFKILFKNLPNYDGDNPESSPIVANYHKQEGTLKLTNGSVIVFAYSTKTDGIKGDEFAGVWMDEVAFYNDLYKVTDMVMTRLSAKKGPLSVLWTTTTHPNNPFNEYYDIAEENTHPQLDQSIPWKINTIQVNSLNNPFLTDRVKEQMRQSQKHNLKQAVKGGFATVDGQVYPMFEDSHIVSFDDIEDDLYDDYRLYSYDSGWDDPRVVLEIGVTTKGQYVVLDEFYESESDVEDAIEWLQNKPAGMLVSEHEPEHISKIRREVDDVTVVKANKSIDDGIESVQERLKSKDGMIGLIVTENASNTISEFRTYTKDVIGTNQADDHCMDCVRYLIHTDTPSPDSQKSVLTNTEDDENSNDIELDSGSNQQQLRKNIKSRNRSRRNNRDRDRGRGR